MRNSSGQFEAAASREGNIVNVKKPLVSGAEQDRDREQRMGTD